MHEKRLTAQRRVPGTRYRHRIAGNGVAVRQVCIVKFSIENQKEKEREREWLSGGSRENVCGRRFYPHYHCVAGASDDRWRIMQGNEHRTSDNGQHCSPGLKAYYVTLSTCSTKRTMQVKQVAKKPGVTMIVRGGINQESYCKYSI